MGFLSQLLAAKAKRHSWLRLEPLEPRVLLDAGLWLTQLVPTGGAGQPFDTMALQFSEAVQDGSFTLDDVQLSDGVGPINPVGLNKLADDRYELLVKRVKEAHGRIDAEAALGLMDRPVSMNSNLHNVLFETSTGRFWVAHASPEGQPAAEQPYRGFDLRDLLTHKPGPDAVELPGPDPAAVGETVAAGAN